MKHLHLLFSKLYNLASLTLTKLATCSFLGRRDERTVGTDYDWNDLGTVESVWASIRSSYVYLCVGHERRV